MTAESQLISPSASTPAEIFRVNVRQEVIRVVLQSIDWGRTARKCNAMLAGLLHAYDEYSILLVIAFRGYIRPCISC